MTPETRALQYIFNTNGGATLANFHEDHEPIGPQLWAELTQKGLACEDSGRVVLTQAGVKILVPKVT